MTLRASELAPRVAVLWYPAPSGPVLALSEAGTPYTATHPAALCQTEPDSVVTPLDLAAREHLGRLLHAAVPTHPRWHVSAALGKPVPVAFAWFGADVLAGQMPDVLTRKSRPALWVGGSAEDAVRRGLAALARLQIPAVAAPCPPEAWSVGLTTGAPRARQTTP